MGKIKPLASHVVDQIAAGEVLERPAQMIKELIENAIDASATEVTVEIERNQYSVRDNGNGMDKEDLIACTQRFATSKLETFEDLDRITDYGFRGEALACVAAVSELTIRSKTAGPDPIGYDLQVVFGERAEPLEVSHSKGTVVTVSRMFENVPARLKFLKGQQAEKNAIREVVKAFALAKPNLSIKLLIDQKLDLVFSGSQSTLQRAQQALGVPRLYFVEDLVSEDSVCRAHFSSPSDVHKSSRNIWIFVNGRWVQDRTVQAAIIKAYQGLLMHGEYPSVCLQLQVPSDWVDVNVHPTKSQVRFRDGSAIFKWVYETLRSAIEKAPWIEWKSSQGAPAKESLQTVSFSQMDLSGGEKAKWNSEGAESLAPSDASYDFRRVQLPRKQFVREQVQSPVQYESPGNRFWSLLEPLGQYHLTYILAESPDGSLYLVDQHAAHERVRYEEICEQFKRGFFDSQQALIPLVFDCTSPDVAQAFVDLRDEFESKLGIAVERVSAQEISVNSWPSLLSEKALIEAVHWIQEQVADSKTRFTLEDVFGDLFATFACHSVVRAGQALSYHEMKKLLEQMDAYPLSGYCPHGRPVHFALSLSQIERSFGRA